MLPEQHHRLQPHTEHAVQAGGQPEPRIWSKMPEGQQSPHLRTATYKSIGRDAAEPVGLQEQEFLLPHPELKSLSLSFTGGIKDSLIKTSLPCAVRCLDVLNTLLQSAQCAVLPSNCCFSWEGCSAGKCLGWQSLRRSCRASLSGRVTASASFFLRSAWVFYFFPIHQDTFLSILVGHRMLQLPVQVKALLAHLLCTVC